MTVSIPLALCDVFPETPTQSFVTTRFGSCEQGQIIAKMFPERVVRMQQTHSANVACYRPTPKPDLKSTPSHRMDSEGGICIPDTDALWTTETDTLLLVKTADCLPLSFYHPAGIVGVIHAGRKGLQTGLIANTFRDVLQALAAPENDRFSRQEFWIHYGPSICVQCYQIDREINLHMDLRQHAVFQVQQALAGHGLRETFSPFCTACHHHLFFSYRGGDSVDRLYSGIMRPGPEI